MVLFWLCLWVTAIWGIKCQSEKFEEVCLCVGGHVLHFWILYSVFLFLFEVSGWETVWMHTFSEFFSVRFTHSFPHSHKSLQTLGLNLDLEIWNLFTFTFTDHFVKYVHLNPKILSESLNLLV